MEVVVDGASSFKTDGPRTIRDLKFEFSQSNQALYQEMKKIESSSKKPKFTIASLFEHEDNTEMDIDNLQNELEKQLTAEIKDRKRTITNKPTLQKHLFIRLLTLTYFTEPSFTSASKIVKMARTGDIVLLKKSVKFSFGGIDQQITNGILSCTTNNFVSTKQSVQSWNQVGIVVELFDISNKLIPSTIKRNKPITSIKYCILADTNGVKLIELKQLLMTSLVENLPVALRPLVITPMNREVEIISKIQRFGLILLKQFNGSWYYDHANQINNIAIEIQTQKNTHITEMEGVDPPIGSTNNSKKLNISEETSPKVFSPENSTDSCSSQDERIFQNLIMVVSHRAKLTLYSPSIESIAEARRAFFLLDENGSGSVLVSEIIPLLYSFINTNNSNNYNHSKLNDRNSILNYLNQLNLKSTNTITVYEYIEIFKKLPVYVPNSNLDLESIMNAEFVACLYWVCGLLKLEYITDDISYFPYSFSSIQVQTDIGINVLPKNSIFCQKSTVAPVNCNQGRYLNACVMNYMLVNARLKKEVLLKLN